MDKIINPSILSANFMNLERDLCILEKNGIEKIHVDIMDGNFVPNITFGVDQVSCLKSKTKFYLDCHLMVDEPGRFIDKFIDLSVGCITVHAESSKHIYRVLERIKNSGIHCGIALNPGTSIYNIVDLIEVVDKVLIMTVNPGFGGQKFIENMVNKISLLNEMMYKNNIKNVDIQVDGGINLDTIDKVYNLGVRDIVVGSYIFNGDKISENIESLRKRIKLL